MIKPIRDQILFKPIEAEETQDGGIYIPDSMKQSKYLRAKVVAVGSGVRDEKGQIQPFDVTIGDTVLLGKFGPLELKIAGEKYLLGSQELILAIEVPANE